MLFKSVLQNCYPLHMFVPESAIIAKYTFEEEIAVSEQIFGGSREWGQKG